MLKKITALLLVLAFTHVNAATPVRQANAFSSELNRSLDDLNFKINVEWDQKDTKFFDQSITNFENEIAALQKEGLTTKDLVNHALAKIKDKQVLGDIGRMANVVEENQMSPDEARAFVVSKLNSTYSHGASWSGRGQATIYAVAAIICVLIWTNATHKSEKNVYVSFPQLNPYLP